jgi:hypothetical protein
MTPTACESARAIEFLPRRRTVQAQALYLWALLGRFRVTFFMLFLLVVGGGTLLHFLLLRVPAGRCALLQDPRQDRRPDQHLLPAGDHRPASRQARANSPLKRKRGNVTHCSMKSRFSLSLGPRNAAGSRASNL